MNENLTRANVLGEAFSKRQYSLTQLTNKLVIGGFVENPDEVLRQFGGPEGIRFYLRMERQFPFLASPVSQRIDPVIATERQVIPGDANSDMSVQMANDVRRIWSDIKNKEVLLRKALMGQFYGYSPLEKVWGMHAATGLLAPVGEKGDGNGIFDVPVQNIRFGPNGEEKVITGYNYRAAPVLSRKLMIFRWGSVASPYGEGEFKKIYLATWYMQIIIDYGLKALELLGRPIPVLYIPRNTANQSLVQEMVDAIAAQFDFYVTLPTDEARPRFEIIGGNVAASGSAGRAEQEWARYLENWIWNALINTAQTQDRGGQGNGKLEAERSELKGDKIATASDATDSFLTEGFSDDISEVNWGNQPRQLWPRFKSDITEVTQAGLTGIQMQEIDRQLRRLIARQVAEEQVIEVLTCAGVPPTRVLRMVQATVVRRDRGELTLSPDIAGDVAAQPTAAEQEAQKEEAAA